MTAISLLWLLLPSVGLAAYIQYTASHYDKKIEPIENKINDISPPLSLTNGRDFDLTDDMYNHYQEIIKTKGEKNIFSIKDKTQSILRLIIWFIAIVVVFQFISLSVFDIFSLASHENPSAKWFVFFVLLSLVCRFLFLYMTSIKHIDTKKQEWEQAIKIHHICNRNAEVKKAYDSVGDKS